MATNTNTPATEKKMGSYKVITTIIQNDRIVGAPIVTRWRDESPTKALVQAAVAQRTAGATLAVDNNYNVTATFDSGLIMFLAVEVNGVAQDSLTGCLISNTKPWLQVAPAKVVESNESLADLLG
jgi:hypothetical protein